MTTTSHLHRTTLETAFGRVTLLGHERAIVGVYWGAHAGAPDLAAIGRADRDPLLVRARAQLIEYLEGRRRRFDLPTEASGTAFQLAVWRALVAIPFGDRISYSELARRIGRPRAVRAVGSANGRNPLSILVPCHRVIGSDGGLAGYAGGLAAKEWLLAHERSRDQRHPLADEAVSHHP